MCSNQNCGRGPRTTFHPAMACLSFQETIAKEQVPFYATYSWASEDGTFPGVDAFYDEDISDKLSVCRDCHSEAMLSRHFFSRFRDRSTTSCHKVIFEWGPLTIVKNSSQSYLAYLGNPITFRKKAPTEFCANLLCTWSVRTFGQTRGGGGGGGGGTRDRFRVSLPYYPFTPAKSDQFQHSPAASPVILHHRSMENSAFHSLLKMKGDYTTNSHYLGYTVSVKGWEWCAFWTWEWKVKRIYNFTLCVKGRPPHSSPFLPLQPHNFRWFRVLRWNAWKRKLLTFVLF